MHTLAAGLLITSDDTTSRTCSWLQHYCMPVHPFAQTEWCRNTNPPLTSTALQHRMPPRLLRAATQRHGYCTTPSLSTSYGMGATVCICTPVIVKPVRGCFTSRRRSYLSSRSAQETDK